jgi:hypothetical protein
MFRAQRNHFAVHVVLNQCLRHFVGIRPLECPVERSVTDWLSRSCMQIVQIWVSERFLHKRRHAVKDRTQVSTVARSRASTVIRLNWSNIRSLDSKSSARGLVPGNISPKGRDALSPILRMVSKTCLPLMPCRSSVLGLPSLPMMSSNCSRVEEPCKYNACLLILHIRPATNDAHPKKWSATQNFRKDATHSPEIDWRPVHIAFTQQLWRPIPPCHNVLSQFRVAGFRNATCKPEVADRQIAVTAHTPW